MAAVFESYHASITKIEEGELIRGQTDIVTLLICWQEDDEMQEVELEVPVGTFQLRDKVRVELHKTDQFGFEKIV